MEFFFTDDARQGRPSRPGMGPLVAIGGILVPGQAVWHLERAIDTLCADYGFPQGEEFKWSPGRDLWMRDNLVGETREAFFIDVLSMAERGGVKAIVVIEDTNLRTATSAPNAEMDVTRLFLERVNIQLRRMRSEGIVIVDRPSGDRANEDRFLANCLETLQAGTTYVKPDRIVLNVLSTPSKLVRLLQAADVVSSCTVAAVGGEARFSPPVFALIKRLLFSDMGRIGGVGLKIHPDYRYANLYHWLLGDLHFWKAGAGVSLPLTDRPYSSDQLIS
ncbi:MAG: DUF3800 domain-containing protein [Chloroflexota bacterium]